MDYFVLQTVGFRDVSAGHCGRPPRRTQLPLSQPHAPQHPSRLSRVRADTECAQETQPLLH